MKSTSILLALVSMILMCCSSHPGYNPEIIEKEVLVFLEDYQKAMNEEGLLSEFRFLDSTSFFYWVPPGYNSFLDFDSVQKILKATAPILKNINNRWDYLHVYPLSDTIATYTGRLNMENQDTSGKLNIATLLETGVVVKRKDGWKILSGQSRVIEN